MASSEQVNLDLTATDKGASKAVDKLADKVEDLEHASPAEVELTADGSDLNREVVKAADRLEDLAKRDVEVALRAKIDALQRELKQAEGDLAHLADKADDTAKHVDGIGGEQRVSAIRDLSGPLGDVSTNVGDMGDAFVSAGSQVESAMGLAEGSLTNLLGPLGIVAGVAFTFWQKWQEGAKASREEIAKVRDKVLELGATAAASESVTEMLKADPELARNVAAIGLKFSDLVDLVSGRGNTALDRWRELLNTATTATLGYRGALPGTTDRLRDIAEAHGLTLDQMTRLLPKIRDVTGAVDKQAGTFATATGDAKAVADILGRRLTPEMADLTVAADTSTRSLQAVQAELHGVDGTHAKADVTVTDHGTAAATGREIDQAARDRQVVLHVTPDMADLSGRIARELKGVTVTNVTVNAPRGMAAADVVAAGTAYARRNGGRGARR